MPGGRIATTNDPSGAARVESIPGYAATDWQALGSTVRLVVTDPTRLELGRSLLASELGALDATCSRFRDDSELRRLDRSAGRPTRISPLLAEAIGVALRAARLTDGLVDPTVGQAMVSIGYDRDFASVPATGPALPRAVRPVVGWQRVVLDRSGLRVTVPEGVRLDLGATAKALAADRAAARLGRVLRCGVLVSLGGDIAFGGQVPPDGWTIRVQDTPGHPRDLPCGPTATVTVNGGGLATSSTVARRWRRGGVVSHHIVDPLTGLPAQSPWRTVTVHAGTCVDANTASTAALVRGATAPSWLAGRGLPARLVGLDGQVHTVAGWPEDPP